MLLPPQFNEVLGQPPANGGEPMHARMASGAQRDQPFRIIETRFPVMDMEAYLSCPTAAAPAISREHCFPLAGELGAGMRARPVAAAAQTGDGRSSLPAKAEQGSLPGAVPVHRSEDRSGAKGRG